MRKRSSGASRQRRPKTVLPDYNYAESGLRRAASYEDSPPRRIGAVFAFWEVHVGHAIDRRSRHAAWGAVVRYVDDFSIAIATASGIVPNACIDGGLDHRDFPLTSEASVLWAVDAVMRLGAHGIKEVTLSGTPVTIYTDVKAVWSFFHGKLPFSRHKVIQELHDNLEFSCSARRVGNVLRLSRHRTKEQDETWVRDVKLIAPEQNQRARNVAAAALKLWRPIEHNFHDE
jgi:hypothetical protein